MFRRVKRKSSSLKSSDDDESENSDYEENLPSVKRQRISMKAMQRLFAKFSLSDESTSKKPMKNSSSCDSNSKVPLCENKFKLFGLANIAESATTENVNENNNKESTPNRNQDATSSVAEEICQRSVCCEKRNAPICEGKEEREAVSNTGSKRHIDVSDDNSDTKSSPEAPDKTEPQVKKVRHLKRGLRLCSSITCYIEQIVYN